MDSEPTPTDLIAQRVRELRKGRMTTAELADRCAEVGLPRLTAQALYKLEGQRTRRPTRQITVEEMLTLAYLLDIAPVHLMVGLDDDAHFPVTPSLSVDSVHARRWVRGFGAFPPVDLRRYHANVPVSEARTHWQKVPIDEGLDERIESTRDRLAELEQIKRNRDQREVS